MSARNCSTDTGYEIFSFRKMLFFLISVKTIFHVTIEFYGSFSVKENAKIYNMAFFIQCKGINQRSQSQYYLNENLFEVLCFSSLDFKKNFKISNNTVIGILFRDFKIKLCFSEHNFDKIFFFHFLNTPLIRGFIFDDGDLLTMKYFCGGSNVGFVSCVTVSLFCKEFVVMIPDLTRFLQNF